MSAAIRPSDRVMSSVEFVSRKSGSDTLILKPAFNLDRVSANAEKGRGCEWAVRVGQRLLEIHTGFPPGFFFVSKTCHDALSTINQDKESVSVFFTFVTV